MARELGTARFTVLQNQYSLLERRDDEEVLPLCRELGVAYIPYFPLASGLLTGKYRRDEPAPEGTRLEGREIADERFDRVDLCTSFAEERGHTVHELATERARVHAGRGLDHRRRDETRAGACERRGRLVAAHGRRARHAGADLAGRA